MGSVNVSMRLINFSIEQNTLVMKMHASILRSAHVFQASDYYYFLLLLHTHLHHLILMEITLYFK